MKQNILFYLFVIIFLFVSCDKLTDEDECDDVDYSDCNTEEPFRDSLHIKLTINDENEKVKLVIYDGDFEDGIAITQIETEKSKINVEVLLDREYSASAEYISGKDTIIAIDGTNIKKKSKTYCDSTCWSIKNQDLDLRLVD